MDSDLALVLGIFLAALSVPSILAGLSENRPPRSSGLLLLVGVGCMAFAILSHPGGYRLEQIPDVFFSVLGRFFG
ncbi:hypothetical protein [Pseudophaeobacter flagellatus]|uniref:hypothetical protein n=1 Tax=Pseudophaeobacter flagellatus TaxID=2899119 RepID=UPI001E35AE5B|nr:hypothetical protein [Pseudophaeobacter flagellatus]MCD9148075.1 hypothetical protein [Pseudophaeobacter flagellatus]